jgi:hypothetical protein
LKHTDGPEEKLFPAPPLNFSQIKFALIRNVYFRTASRRNYTTETVFVLGGTGDSPQSATRLLEADPPEWIPSNKDKGKGIWRRTVHMQSTMSLSVPPGFNSECLSWDVGRSLYFHAKEI